jgi:hypothetical protein
MFMQVKKMKIQICETDEKVESRQYFEAPHGTERLPSSHPIPPVFPPRA